MHGLQRTAVLDGKHPHLSLLRSLKRNQQLSANLPRFYVPQNVCLTSSSGCGGCI